VEIGEGRWPHEEKIFPTGEEENYKSGMLPAGWNMEKITRFADLESQRKDTK